MRPRASVAENHNCALGGSSSRSNETTTRLVAAKASRTNLFLRSLKSAPKFFRRFEPKSPRTYGKFFFFPAAVIVAAAPTAIVPS